MNNDHDDDKPARDILKKAYGIPVEDGDPCQRINQLASKKLTEVYGSGRTYNTSDSKSTSIVVNNITGFDHIYIGKEPGDDAEIPGYKLLTPSGEKTPAHYVRTYPDETYGFSGHHALRNEPVFMLVDHTVPPHDVYGPYTISMESGAMVPAEGGVEEWPPDAEQMEIVQAFPIKDKHGKTLYDKCIVLFMGKVLILSGYERGYFTAKSVENGSTLIMTNNKDMRSRYFDPSGCEIVSNKYRLESERENGYK